MPAAAPARSIALWVAAWQFRRGRLHAAKLLQVGCAALATALDCGGHLERLSPEHHAALVRAGWTPHHSRMLDALVRMEVLTARFQQLHGNPPDWLETPHGHWHLAYHRRVNEITEALRSGDLDNAIALVRAAVDALTPRTGSGRRRRADDAREARPSEARELPRRAGDRRSPAREGSRSDGH